jgi:hypothetical protein
MRYLKMSVVTIEGQDPFVATKGFLVFVSDPRAFANVIRGVPQADNPKDKGYFHEVSAEFCPRNIA